MTDRDHDLIIDLVENLLSPAEAKAALERVMADPELRTTYEQQKAARTALADAPAVAMTSTERSQLRQSLMSQLNVEAAPARVETKKRRSWWLPVAGLASAAAAVTAIVVLPGTLGSSSDQGVDTVALTEITVATGFTQSEALPPASGGSESSDSGSEQLYDASSAPQVEGKDLPELLQATVGAASIEELNEDLAEFGLRRGFPVDTDAVDACLNKIKDKLPPETTGAFILGVDPAGASTVVHVGLEFSDGIQAAVSIDLSDCSIVVFDS